MENNPQHPESAPKRRKLALGKGLGALIPEAEAGPEPRENYLFCDIGLIRPNRFQPRRQFTDEELEELTASIREQGILQPLVVRRNGPGFELVAGERRLRAARRAGLGQVPVLVKEVNDDQMLELSLVENIQRADLNPMEEADAYHGLINQLHLTQDQAAARVGKSRSAVANFLRLRQLPEPIKASIIDRSVSMGHARALLGADTAAVQLAAWRTVIAKALSVRETEELVRRLKAEKKKPRVERKAGQAPYLTSLSEDLSRQLGTKVTIRKSGRHGRVEIEFYSDDDLERLIEHLRRPNRV